MEKLKAISSNNLEQSLIDWSGESPKNGFDRSKKFIPWGKNNKFRATFSACGNYATGFNHVTQEKQTFYLNGYDHKKIKIPEPYKTKDITEDFYKLSKQPISNHSYLLKKNISIQDLNIRWLSGKIVIPIFSTKNNIISWQTISATGKKKFKYDHPLGKGHHFPIGNPESETVYICEGFATGATIYEITKQRVYCALSKGNLDHVVKYCLEKYPKKKIALCLDNDAEHTQKTKIQDDRLIVLCPESEGDFNDHPEKNKLINCQPTHNTKKETPREIAELKNKFKQLGYEIRLNTRRERIEIKGFHSKSWNEISKGDLSELFYEIKNLNPHHKLIKSSFDIQYHALANINKIDPFKSWLESLPEWDKQERLKTFLSECFTIEKKHNPLAEWSLKSILLAIVKRTYIPGHKHDEMVIFKGKQGIGKSSFFYNLFSDKDFFTNTVSFDMEYHRIVEGILGKCLCEVAEMSGFKKASIEKLKNILSTQKDTARLAYRYDARDYGRQTVFVGTTNDQSPLPSDITGLRRFILIELKQNLSYYDIKKKLKEDRDQLWAEALVAYHKKESARLPKKLWELSAEIAEENRGGDHSFEQVFLREVQGMNEVNIPEVLKEIKDGRDDATKDGRVFQVGGKWIRDITPKLQSLAAELLKKDGYVPARKLEFGRKIRIWKKVNGP